MNNRPFIKGDNVLLLMVFILCCIGLLVVYSSSVHLADYEKDGRHYFYLGKQLIFTVVGIFLMFGMKKIPCDYFVKPVYMIMMLNLLLMTLVLIPGIGFKAGGATRWFSIFGVSFQPSELLKLSLSIYMAYSMSKKESMMTTFWRGLVPHLLIVCLFMMLLISQPDFGTASIIGIWLFILLFIAGTKFRYMFWVFVLGGLLFVFFIFQEEYRVDRFMAFLHPDSDPLGVNYQINHSLWAFGSGGIFGTGIGSSKQALMYLPEAHTDFALSILAEETGLMGVTIVIVLFGILLWRGVQISLNTRDLYKTYLALGIVIMIGLQALINMCVVMSLLPNKGLPLPFISYGGSSLIFNLISVGVLLNISQER